MSAKVESGKWKVSVGQVLLYLAALFQSTQYARAFHAIDTSSGWSEFGGLIAGVVVNLSLAYSASRLPRLRAKGARRLSYAAFWTLLVLTPLFVAPINYKTMGDLWSDVWQVKALLAVVSASLVDVAIILVAFADGSLLPAEGSQTPAAATQSTKPTARNSQNSQPAPQTAETTAQNSQPAKFYECTWTNCDAKFDKPQSFSAHMSQHRRAEAKELKRIQAEKVQP